VTQVLQLLVDFLRSARGLNPSFVDLYNRCGTDTFEDDFRAVYLLSLGQLEEQFWREANQLVLDSSSSSS